MSNTAPRLLRFLLRRRAIASCRRRVAEDPHRPELHLTLGGLLAEAGQSAEALEALLLASHLYSVNGLAEEALDASVKICRLFPAVPALWLEAADAYVRQARTVEGVHCLIDGARVQLERRDWDSAVELLQYAAQLAPAPLKDLGAGCQALSEESPWREPLLALARTAEQNAASAATAPRGEEAFNAALQPLTRAVLAATGR